MAYLRGDGLSFTPRVIWKAPHANWGSSGLSLADLDADGDLDLLLANGDTFDDSLLKPYHGLAWLERKASRLGSNAFALHRLADMPGPHSVVASDLDGDGDVDVLASALIAGGGGSDDERLPAVVWLEQTARVASSAARSRSGRRATRRLPQGTTTAMAMSTWSRGTWRRRARLRRGSIFGKTLNAKQEIRRSGAITGSHRNHESLRSKCS